MAKNKLVKLLYIFLILHPIMDLGTALMTRFEIGMVSIGVILRGLFLFLMLVYLFFFNSSKYKKKSICYIFLIFIFSVIYFLTKPELLNKSFLLNEGIYLFKYMYFPIVFTCLFNLHDEAVLDKNKIVNIFFINLLVYSFLIIIPFITNTSFNSYAKNKGVGVVGWFFSANEIGAILSIIFPLVFLYINKSVKLSIVLSLLLVLFSVMLMGTKVAFFGCVGAIIVVLFYYIINFKKYKKTHFVLTIVLLLFVFLISSNLPVMKNINRRMRYYNSVNNASVVEKSTTNDSSNKQVEKKDNKTITNNNQARIDNTNPKFMLSSRDRLWSRVYNIYKTRDLGEKLFGIGFSNRNSIDDARIEKLIEMDFFDIVLRYGILGLIIYLLPFMMVGFLLVKDILINKFKMTIEQYLFLYSTIVGLGAGFIAGHVFSSPPVSIYMALLMIFDLSVFKKEEQKELDKENIYFLALHLGQGGIERATINTANALCEKKNVTIISFYNLKDELYDIDPRVNIKYLYDGGPNRDEFMNSIKNKDIISFIKNAFKACDILLKKKFLMIKEIKKINSGIVVSTTIKFSLLLNDYGKNNVLKVVQEHRYHNNDKKYLRTMKYGYGNIDYIMALTKKLSLDYKDLFRENKKIKIVIMPNMMSNNIYKKSNLDKKVVISVNRLDYGKRVNEIIDIASLVKDLGWKFKLIGDGKEFNNLKRQIDELKLNDVVQLMGVLSNEKVIEELSKSSIYVTTSVTEGFAISLIEACSVGLPCICYEIENDLSDIVKNNQNGYIIKDRNEEEFVKKLRFLMTNAEKRKIFGKKSQVVSREFSPDVISRKWFDFIDKSSL